MAIDSRLAPPLEPCPHRPACPGCPRFGEPDVAPVARRSVQQWALGHGVRVQWRTGPSLGFRHRARLAVRQRHGRVAVGLFAAASHDIVDTPRCAVHHAEINRVAAVVKQSMSRLGVAAYDEASGTGLVRYLQLVVQRQTGRIQLVVVGNCESAAPLRPLFEQLQRRTSKQLHSVFFNAQPRRTNTILGERFERICGSPMLQDHVAGTTVHYPPGAFGQANPVLFERIAQQVRGWAEPFEHVVELYCGVGALGLGLATPQRRLVLNEISPWGLEGLRAGFSQLQPQVRQHVQIVEGAAQAVAPSVLHPDACVIVDPPRKGLGASLLQQLLAQPVQRLIYVACGLPAFLRDAEQLTQRYRCRELSGYGLFPFTEHVEIVACFERI